MGHLEAKGFEKGSLCTTATCQMTVQGLARAPPSTPPQAERNNILAAVRSPHLSSLSGCLSRWGGMANVLGQCLRRRQKKAVVSSAVKLPRHTFKRGIARFIHHLRGASTIAGHEVTAWLVA